MECGGLPPPHQCWVPAACRGRVRDVDASSLDILLGFSVRIEEGVCFVSGHGFSRGTILGRDYLTGIQQRAPAFRQDALDLA
jgi:hypothetical protein